MQGLPGRGSEALGLEEERTEEGGRGVGGALREGERCAGWRAGGGRKARISMTTGDFLLLGTPGLEGILPSVTTWAQRGPRGLPRVT